MAINPLTGLEEDDGAGGSSGAPMGAAQGNGYAPGTPLPGNGLDMLDQAISPALAPLNRAVTGAMALQGQPFQARAIADATGANTGGVRAGEVPPEVGPGAGDNAPPIPPPPNIASAPAAPVDFRPITKAGLVKTGSETTVTSTKLDSEGRKINKELTEREKGLEATERKAADFTAEKALAERAGAVGEQKAQIEADDAQKAKEITDQNQAESAKLAADHDALIAKAQATSEEERKRYQSMGLRGFFDDKSSAQKAGILLGIALGGIGAAISGDRRNQAMDQLNTMIDRDAAEQKAKIELQHQKMIDAGADVNQARAMRGAAMVDLEHKKAGLMGALKDDTAAKLKARGMADAAIEKDAAVQGFARKEQVAAIAAQRSGMSFLEQQQALHVQHVASKTTHEMKEGGPGAAAGKITPTESKELAELDESIKNIDRLAGVIQKNPSAWNEYRSNSEDWARKERLNDVPGAKNVRAAGQALGLVDVAPEQGLKNSTSRQIHREMEKIKTTIAKSGGGVVTEGDRRAAASGMATLATGAKEQADLLKRTRDDLIAKRNAFMASRGGGGATSVAPAPAASGPDVAGAKLWLSKNPNDPSAAAIRQRLQALGAL